MDTLQQPKNMSASQFQTLVALYTLTGYDPRNLVMTSRTRYIPRGGNPVLDESVQGTMMGSIGEAEQIPSEWTDGKAVLVDTDSRGSLWNKQSWENVHTIEDLGEGKFKMTSIRGFLPFEEEEHRTQVAYFEAVQVEEGYDYVLVVDPLSDGNAVYVRLDVTLNGEPIASEVTYSVEPVDWGETEASEKRREMYPDRNFPVIHGWRAAKMPFTGARLFEQITKSDLGIHITTDIRQRGRDVVHVHNPGRVRVKATYRYDDNGRPKSHTVEEVIDASAVLEMYDYFAHNLEPIQD